MIATTIEQSQHLLELGLDPKTADMFWKYSASLGNTDINGRIAVSYHDNLFVGKYDGAIPAWSLSALLDVMPKELVNVGYNKKGEQVVSLDKLIIDTFIVDERSMWRIGYKGKRRYWVKCYSDNPIRAAWDMISFLIRQGYIKKGGER